MTHYQFWLGNSLVRLGEHQREGAKLRLDYLHIIEKAESYRNVDCSKIKVIWRCVLDFTANNQQHWLTEPLTWWPKCDKLAASFKRPAVNKMTLLVRCQNRELKRWSSTLNHRSAFQALSISDETKEATTTFNLRQKEWWSRTNKVFFLTATISCLLFLIPHYHNTSATQSIISLELQGIPIRTKAAGEIPSPHQKTILVFLHNLLCPIYISSVVQKSAVVENILAEIIWELQHVKMMTINIS